ncbi:MAG TPA: hypothetical protein VGM23_15190, partial [Armatimonadota bacterium]
MRCPLLLSLVLLSLWLTVVAMAGQEFSLRDGLGCLGLGEVSDAGNKAPRLLFAGGAPLLRDFNATYVPLGRALSSYGLTGEEPYPRPETLIWRTLAALPSAEYQLGDGKVYGALPMVSYQTSRASLASSCWQRRLLFIKKADDWALEYLLVRDDFATLHPPTIANWWIRTDTLWVSGNLAHAGRLGSAGLDLYVAQPETPAFTPIDWGNERQLCVHAPGRNPCFLTVFYPCGGDTPQPEMTTIAGGNGVKIVTPADGEAHPGATAYAFLSPTRITFDEGSVSFSGNAGMIRLAKDEQRIVLAAGGTVTTPGVTLQAGGPVSIRLEGREMHVYTNGAAQLIRLSGTFASWQVT